MIEFVLFMAALFFAYLLLPASWLAKWPALKKNEVSTHASEQKPLIPEDSVLKRHYLTQLRSEIEQELFPRPTDFNLQRHYDSLIAAEIENRVSLASA